MYVLLRIENRFFISCKLTAAHPGGGFCDIGAINCCLAVQAPSAAKPPLAPPLGELAPPKGGD